MGINSNHSNCPICKNTSASLISRYYGTVTPFNKKVNRVVQCNNCSLAYLVPIPDQIELNRFYSSYWVSETAVQSSSKESLEVYKAESFSRLSYLVNKIGSLKNKRILDFGAGHGLFGKVLNERGHDTSYYAVETDKEIVNGLKKEGINAATKIEELNKKDFDIIVVFHVLEHIINPMEFIKFLIKYLKKGGVLFLEIPNKDYMFKKLFEPHVLFFNANSLDVLLNEFPFYDIEIVGCGRELDNIPKERSMKKVFRRQIGNILRLMGFRKKNSRDNNILNIEMIREIYEMDKLGRERQWLRAIAKK